MTRNTLRSACFSATHFNFVAFRVICQHPNSMKTENYNPFKSEIYLAAVDKRRFQFIQADSQ